MNTGRPMEHDLLFDFLRVVEAAAVEAARTMGRGDRKYPIVAVERMREVMDTIPMDGTIVRRGRARRGPNALHRRARGVWR